MDGLGSCNLGGGYDPGDIQVAVLRRGRTDTNVLVGETDVERFPVRFRVYRHRLYAEFVACPDDPQGYLATIGDQQLVEHSAYP